MKKIYTLIIGTLLCFGINAQTYQWAANPGFYWAQRIKCDNMGNSYTAGALSGTTGVAKYNTSGTLLWSFTISGTATANGADISLDALKNVYVTGTFAGTVDFNPSAGTNLLVSSSGSTDIFLAKYDSLGNYIWAFKIGNANDENAYAVEADASGNVYITGRKNTTAGSVDFDPGAGTANLTGNGAFLAKYNTLGAYQWAFIISGASGQDLCFDSSDNIYMYGSSGAGMDFDPGPGTANLAGSMLSIFVAKYNSSGIFQSLFSIADAQPNTTEQDYGINIDASNNIYCTGSMNGSAIDFDPGAGTVNLISAGSSDIFVAKYNSTGAYQWAFIIGGANEDSGYGITNDVAGNCYVSGKFDSNGADFDPGAGSAPLSAFVGGNADIFVASYNSAGQYRWAFGIGNAPTDATGYEIGSGVCLNNLSNAVMVSGTYNDSKDFDPSPANATLYGSLGYNAFVAKYTQCSTLSQPGAIAGTTTICSGSSNTYSVSAVAGATSYTWTLPSGWTGTSTTNSINTNASTVSGNITVTAINVCGNSMAQTLAITVNTIPATPGTITGSTPVCSGSSNTYSITAVAGATSYTWTLPGGWTGTSTTNSITTTASATSGNITVKANNTCGSSSVQTKAVTVTTAPSTPGAITGTTPVCSGSSNTYSITAVAGATSYTWTLPVGWTGTSTTNSITTTASATSGNITVTANNSCGSSSVQTKAIVVNTIPSTPGIISGTATICSGTTNTYSIIAVAGATSYTWTLPGGWTGTSTTNNISTTASATSGNITVTANNSCGNSTAQTLAITVNTIPTTPGTISGITTICSGSSNTYSITAIAGATSYTWTLPGGWTGISTTNSITTTASATSGNITVTANNSCGNSSAATLIITVNTIPPTPGTISGNNSVCIGSSNTYSVTAVAGATSYTWVVPSGWTGTSTTNSISTTASATSGNITVTANNTCGNSSPQTLSVTVNPLPTVTYSQSPAMVCANATSVPLGTVSPTGGAFSGIGVTGSTFNAVTAGTGTFTITYTYTDVNSCVNTDTSSIAVSACTGLSSISAEEDISIYPNPTSSIINVIASGTKQSIIMVYNILGESIYSTISSSDKTEIDLSKEVNGIYFIQIISEKGIVTKRIIKN